MDMGFDDELDYEEDVLVNTAENGLQNENLSGSEDQYLQIDCQEEEESLFSMQEPVDDVSTKTQNVNEDNSEEGKIINKSPQNSSSGEQQATEINDSKSVTNNVATATASTNTSPRITNTLNKNEKRSDSYRRKPETNEEINSFSHISSPLAEPNFGAPRNLNNRYSDSASLQETQNFYSHQNLFSSPHNNLQPLMSIKSSPVPYSLIGSSKKYRLGGRRNKFGRRHYSCPSFNNNHSKLINSENVRSKNGIFEQKTNNRQRKNQYISNENFQTTKTQRNFSHRTFQDQNLKSTGTSLKLSESRTRKRSNSISSDLQFNIMKPDEKELVSLKKKARLKRFSNDETVRKERKSNDSDVNEKWNLGNLEKEYFQKMAEQKLTRERFFSLKGQRINCYSDQNFQTEKPNINKETLLEKMNPFDTFVKFKKFSNFRIEKPNISKDTLLKKRNPFDESCKTLVGVEIKKESVTCKEIKKENFACIKTDTQFIKNDVNNLGSLGFAGQNFIDVKIEAKSPVKFVRTISKCFDELTLKKPKTEVIFNNNTNELPISNQKLTVPSLEENRLSSLIQNFPTQIESQLTGCIVKVLNIPPTTTTNDILALCCPIGMVREVKLNFPKENSVVIRFVEPACAEKFFSLYHGQKMNNYFLNVIVV